MVKKTQAKESDSTERKKGLTQSQLAEKIGLSTNYISAVERGVNSLNRDKLVAVMNCLECSADEIFMDVLDNGYKIKISLLTEQISQLPKREQEIIFAVVQTLVDSAKNYLI